EARVARLADEGKDFSAGAPLGPEAGEPLAAARDYEGNVAPGLDVVYVRRPSLVSALGGEGRARQGPSRLSLGAGDEGGLLAADEGSGAGHDLDIEGESGVEYA